MSELYLVQGVDGQVVAFGPIQAQWLERGGFIEPTDQPNVWRALHGLTMEDVHKLVMAQPDLRECDFCRTIPAGWRIKCRPFVLTLGPYAGARLGGADRPVFACDVCVRYVRENRKQQLVEYVIAATVEKARAGGGELRQIAETQPWPLIKRHLTPVVKEVVYGMFAHRVGQPERDNDDDTDERNAA